MKNRKPRKDGRYIINVSFTESELSLISWADKHGNFSNYVKKLIEEDMKKGDMQGEAIQTLLRTLINQEGLKNIFQNSTNINKEVAPEVEKPKKADKGKTLGAIAKLKGNK